MAKTSSGKMKQRQIKREIKEYSESLTEDDYSFAREQLKRKDLFKGIFAQLKMPERIEAKHIIARSINTFLKRTHIKMYFAFNCSRRARTLDDNSFREWLKDQIVQVGTTRPANKRLVEILATVMPADTKKAAMKKELFGLDHVEGAEKEHSDMELEERSLEHSDMELDESNNMLVPCHLRLRDADSAVQPGEIDNHDRVSGIGGGLSDVGDVVGHEQEKDVGTDGQSEGICMRMQKCKV